MFDDNSFLKLPSLGVGLAYRNCYRDQLTEVIKQRIDFIEIIAENYFNTNSSVRQELQQLSHDFVIIPHGVNLSLGSVDGVDGEHLRCVQKLTKTLNCPWFSEHICFTKIANLAIGHLTPLPFTEEAIETICQNIKSFYSRVDIPLILENISYLFTMPFSTMSEQAFITEILNKSNTGLLLDVTNLYANCLNHGYNPFDFIEALPLERIVQLHFTGGEWFKKNYLDTHSTETPEEVWQLMEEILNIAPVKGIVLERDDAPQIIELLPELERAQTLWKKYH